MAWPALAKLSAAATLAAALAGCATPAADPPPPAPRGPEELRLSFEDMLAPGVFDWTGPAAADPEGAPGLWAVVPGLARPERARVALAGGEAHVDVALFRGAAGRGGAIRISAAAAEALGVGDGPARVRVTALRREPRLAETAAGPATGPATAAKPASGPAALIGRLF
ncbi:hypothetical protein [Amaricoccus sp.]|uniref:hypothetical protein n=1 Tax=Amaricoccus sp. TaxID=1872485 RepID=UPI001B56EDFE|nr:hypothetical protein [Amaricoccus sp.]MBP7002603.1 hypothetical protein [Amaricoccus sp.]